MHKDRDLKFQVCNHGLLFQMISSHHEALQELIKDCFITSKDAFVNQEIPRELGDLLGLHSNAKY